MKATEQYFPVVLFITIHKLVESVNEILKKVHSRQKNETKQNFHHMYTCDCYDFLGEI